MATSSKGFTPQKMRGLLGFLLVVVVLGSGGGFYLALQETREYGTEVNHRLADADASLEQLNGLQALKNTLDQSENLVNQANQVFATQDNYQGQALTDVRNYANAAGLTVANTRFADTAEGYRTIVVSFADDGLTYSGLVHFLENVEGNVPKMQVTSLPLTHVAGGGSNAVEVGDVVIRIFVR